MAVATMESSHGGDPWGIGNLRTEKKLRNESHAGKVAIGRNRRDHG